MRKIGFGIAGLAMLYCFVEAVGKENTSAMWGWVTALFFAALLNHFIGKQMHERRMVMTLVAPMRAFMRIHKGALPEGVSPKEFMKELDAVMRGDVALFAEEEKMKGGTRGNE